MRLSFAVERVEAGGGLVEYMHVDKCCIEVWSSCVACAGESQLEITERYELGGMKYGVP